MGLAESNGSLPPDLWLLVICGLIAEDQDQLWNHMLVSSMELPLEPIRGFCDLWLLYSARQ